MNEMVKVAIDTVQGTLVNFSAGQGSTVIRNAFVEMMGTDKPDYKTFRKNKNEIFEILEEALDVLIVSGWGANPFFQQFVEFRDTNLGDNVEFTVDDTSLLTVAKIARGNLDLRRQKLDVGSSFTVTTNVYGIAVYADFLRFLAGRLDWTALVQKCYDAFNLKSNDEIASAMKGSISAIPAAFKTAGAFVADTLATMVSHVKTACGGPVILAGTEVGLSKLYGTPDITWSDGMKEELNKTGKIGFWRGVPMMVIPQIHTPNTYDFGMDDTQIYILPSNTKPIKFVNTGTAIIKEVSDGLTNLDMSMEYTLIKEFGVSVVFNVLYGMYDWT